MGLLGFFPYRGKKPFFLESIPILSVQQSPGHRLSVDRDYQQRRRCGQTSCSSMAARPLMAREPKCH